MVFHSYEFKQEILIKYKDYEWTYLFLKGGEMEITILGISQTKTDEVMLSNQWIWAPRLRSRRGVNVTSWGKIEEICIDEMKQIRPMDDNSIYLLQPYRTLMKELTQKTGKSMKGFSKAIGPNTILLCWLPCLENMYTEVCFDQITNSVTSPVC